MRAVQNATAHSAHSARATCSRAWQITWRRVCCADVGSHRRRSRSSDGLLFTDHRCAVGSVRMGLDRSRAGCSSRHGRRGDDPRWTGLRCVWRVAAVTSQQPKRCERGEAENGRCATIEDRTPVRPAHWLSGWPLPMHCSFSRGIEVYPEWHDGPPFMMWECGEMSLGFDYSWWLSREMCESSIRPAPPTCRTAPGDGDQHDCAGTETS